MRNKYLNLLVVLLLLVAVPSVAVSAMDDYCSAPPYVTRTIVPNIMILMDNSEDMLKPAYPEAVYNPNKDYFGYFKPEACYDYTTKFVEVLNSGVSYTMADTCPATAPFRGNLMNWATTSKYDALQEVIQGGNATSKQGNAHTLVSISNAWPTGRNYNGCEFRMDSGNLTIHDYLFEGACSLLNSVPSPIAMSVEPVIEPATVELRDLLVDYVEQATGGAKQLFATAYDFWDSIDLVTEAWAAGATCYAIQPGPLNGSMDTTFYLILTLPQNLNNKTATWSWTVGDETLPSWLSFDHYADYNNKLTNNGVVVFKGTPPAPGSYPIKVSVSSDGCTGGEPIEDTIEIAAQPLKINHFETALPDGKVGESYKFEPNGQGGVAPLIWDAYGLPLGLDVGTLTSGTVTEYFIEGTPETAGSYTVDLILQDSASPANNTFKTLDLTIHPALEITTNSLPFNPVNNFYTATLEATGGPLPYTWSIIGGALPLGVFLDPATGVISGTPTVPGTYPLTVQVKDSATTSNIAMKDFIIVIDASALVSKIIASDSILPTAYKDTPYTYKIQVMKYTAPFSSQVWSISGQPAGMIIDPATGEISWTPTANVDTTYTGIVVSLTAIWDGNGVSYSDTQTFSITSLASLRSKSYTVKVELIEEPLTDLNGNDYWDPGETFVDTNSNGVWDGKGGIFHSFWDDVEPKARWGMTKFTNSAVNVASCLPVTNAASFFTDVQNATAASSSPLADGLYGALNYYGFDTPYGSDSGNNFTGCTNSDPIDSIPCRKNFLLVISSGSDLSGNSFATGAPCEFADPLIQNACYGYQQDLRSDSDGKQNVHTYIVNTMGENVANNATLEAASNAGGGVNGSQYFEATNAAELEDKLKGAIEDILSQAASGTAVSVLTTSSRGIGSMMQAYFLPIRQEAAREVRWTGYVQNLWIDPDDNLREDSTQDYQLNLNNDKVLKLYFDEATNETMAALFDQTALDTCNNPVLKDFNKVSYTWEGGKKLALRDPGGTDGRALFTAKKAIHGATSTSFTNAEFNTSMDAALQAALNADATYSVNDIIGYVRGECLETGVTGNSECSSTVDDTFRDRRVTIPTADGGDTNGNVWKLGDVISSTPKVLAGTPNNTYHIDYGDTTYYNYVSSDSYSQRSSVAIVGANDGILHAFRVGYLKDKDLPSDNIIGLFKNFITSADSNHPDENGKIGEEVWGYVPYNALPYLKYLADPDYCHIYYNDLSVRLTDASINGNPTDPRDQASWKTILVGGMRFGGACDGGTPTPPVASVGYSAYYAIDITDAENPVPLWEFSDPDMGYSTGFPSILRTGAPSTNGNWYVAFGSGSTTLPKNATDIARSKDGYLYILDLESGNLVKKVTLGAGEIVGDVLTIDKNKDYISERLYFGTSYYDSGASTWKGRLIGMDIPNQDLTAAWTPGVEPIFTGNFPFTASPDAASDVPGNTWLYAGSGKYFSDADEGTLEDNIFVGIKDELGSVTYPVDVTTTGMDDKTTATTTGTVTETAQVCSYDPTEADKFGYKTVVTRTDRTSGVQTTPDIGWFVTLAGGERVISRPLAVGGLVDYLTYRPSADECSYGGDSYLYAVGYTTGEAPNKIAIRNTQTTGGATSGDVTIDRGIKLGPGAPPTGEAIIIPPPKEAQQQLKKKIQVATGVIVEAENTPVLSVTSEIVHWLKK
ncbi:MAG: PilC/PilY family type IV pilus protein [Desulfuromonadales bacterium]|nr:PilC/PilY family type IV pilus protein [Desulfuromonadales bacterium]